ncbi:hypothetical protein ACROYT_G042291 [Oculina patagonica]
MFILNTTSRATNVEKEPMEYDMRFHRLSSNSISPSVYWPKERAPISAISRAESTGYLDIEVLSSKENVSITINGQQRVDTSEMLLRGLNVVVLNEVTGAVMSSRWFDTYESKEDSDFLMEFLKSLKHGRIICFAIKDEATLSLSKNARMFIKGFGSSYINQLKWRGTWAFVVQRLDDRNIVYGESFQDSPEYNQWGKPVKLRTSVKLLAENIVNCNWDDSDASRRRKEFCDKYEGYDNVCNCDNPVSLDFNPPAFQDGGRLKLPLAVMAGNRPSYLLRMLFSLRNVEGLDPNLVTVFIDGFFDEPSSVAKLFELNVEQHAGSGKRNARICQHYKKSLTASFDRYPDANYLVILEEDLYMSVDILSYFKQLLPVLENDESLYCISAWNDQGYDHLANDPAMLYRVETMPGLGWVLNRKLYKNELEKKWPRPDQSADWDMWMRLPSNRKDRECIIPDVSRTYHFGAKGLNVGSFMQNIYFKRHALNNETNVKLDVEKMYKENYEKEIFRLIGEAKLLNHSKNPCANLKDFVPDTTGETYLFYLRMDNPRDYTTWSNVARCFRMWDLDPRGFHKSMWRFWIKKNHILAVGCPASVYCKNKPQDLKPIYLPNKETRPKDPL